MKLDRQMGREERSGLRADVGQPFADSASMGPGSHEPTIGHCNLHVKRAQTAPAQTSWCVHLAVLDCDEVCFLFLVDAVLVPLWLYYFTCDAGSSCLES